jgi:hypothetical protein
MSSYEYLLELEQEFLDSAFHVMKLFGPKDYIPDNVCRIEEVVHFCSMSRSRLTVKYLKKGHQLMNHLVITSPQFPHSPIHSVGAKQTTGSRKHTK